MAYLTLTPQEESNCFMFIGMNKTQNNDGLISNTTSILDSSDSEVGDTCSFYSGPSDSTIFAFGESNSDFDIAYSGAGETCGSIASSGAGETCGSIASSSSSSGGDSSGGGCSYCC